MERVVCMEGTMQFSCRSSFCRVIIEVGLLPQYYVILTVGPNQAELFAGALLIYSHHHSFLLFLDYGRLPILSCQ